MKNKISFILLVVALTTFNSAFAQQVNELLRPLKPLLGSWEMNSPDGRIIEVWKYSSPEKFSGKSYRVGTNKDSTLLEEVDIVEREGQLYYIPTVSGQNSGMPVEFILKSQSGGIYVFENKTHDFPQRVCYHLQSSNELLAWIEGEKNGKTRKSEFRYRRAVN
ncbi:hypothetical protein GZH53_11415 [Flavihumibacter sp. R14]|nr:hypothetical protein [Flavihumibacter soli]